MASIQRFVQITQAFDPEATRTLGQAFDMACALPHASPKASLKPRRQESAIRFACERQD
jgi:hypothetical protein